MFWRLACCAAAACTALASGCASSRPKQSTNPAKRPTRAAPPPSPLPVAEGLRGKIAYSTSAGDIWVMNADGSHGRRLTNSGAGTDFDPDFSPDGRRIVFRTTRFRHPPDRQGIGVDGIHVISVDGTGEKAIQPPDGGLFPAWSPDGDQIAFSSLEHHSAESIFTVHPDGTGLKDLRTRPAGEGAVWSPDGRRIAYGAHANGAPFDVFEMNRDGTRQRRLSTAPGVDSPVAWSPDGRRILFSSQRNGEADVYVMNADGSHQKRLTSSPRSESAQAWLGDGRIVYSVAHPDSPRADFFLMNSDGSAVRRLPQLVAATDPIDWFWPLKGPHP